MLILIATSESTIRGPTQKSMLATDQFLNKGRYRIVSTFGQDGSGATYEAYDTISNTNVVLKETVGNLGKVTTTSQMEAINLAFLGGAKTLTGISHESIVSVQDYFADIDRQYIVLEPVAGFDLTKFLEPDGERPALSDVLSWADQLLDALQYLHTRPTPIVHGDIRPENVKLTADSRVKLLTSCPHTDGTTNLITLAPSRSSDDGGVNYRPLEQLWDTLDTLSQRVILNHYDEESERWLLQPLSAATDLYSLGATLYCVLSGTVPPDALDRSIAALEGKPDPLTALAELNGRVPVEVSGVIMKSMSLRREDRFYSAVILRQILHAAAARVRERVAKDAPTVVTDLEPNQEAQPYPADVMERRLEIETEQLRLQQEREQLVKRRLELDAEMQSQKAEQERLEQETEEAREKFEQGRLAAEAERENLADEQRQREAAPEHEADAKQLTDTQTATETPLLDLDPVRTPSTTSGEISDLLEVPEVPVVNGTASSNLSERETEESFDFILPDSDYQSRGKWRLTAIAAALIVLAGASFGVWKTISSNSAATSTSVVAQPVSVPQQTEVQPPAADSQNLTDVTKPSTDETPSVAAVPETPSHDKGPKPVQLNAAQPKKQPAPGPAKTPPPKRAVTVDDLINDH